MVFTVSLFNPYRYDQRFYAGSQEKFSAYPPDPSILTQLFFPCRAEGRRFAGHIEEGCDFAEFEKGPVG
jgi:hypothetical protein